jgi:hypothetical protein
MATAAKTPAKPRKPKTAAELDAAIKAKEQELARLKQDQAYAAVADKIKNSTLVAEFKKLLGELGGAVTEVALLAAVGKELEIKRLVVMQTDPAKRAPKGTGAKAQSKKAAEAAKK